MLKPAYHVSVLSPSVHPEQDINQRDRLTGLKHKSKNKQMLWEFDPNPYH